MVAWSNIVTAVSAIGVIPAAFAMDWDPNGPSFPRGNCDIGGFEIMTEGGGREMGAAFCAADYKNGNFVTRIEAQADDSVVKFIKIKYLNGDERTYGTENYRGRIPNKNHGVIDIDPAVDRVTTMELWETGKHRWDEPGAVSGIKITLDKSDSHLEVKADKFSADEDVSVKSFGTGFLLGVCGRAGDSVDKLNFIFSDQSIKEFEVHSMELDPPLDQINAWNLNDHDSGIQLEHLDEAYLDNYSENNMQLWLEGSRSLIESSSHQISRGWMRGGGFDIGVDPKIKFENFYGLELGGSLKGGPKFENKGEDVTVTGETTQINQRWAVRGPASPGSRLHCFVYVHKGVMDEVTYKGTLKMIFENDHYLEWPIEGDVSTTDYTTRYFKCESATLDDINRGREEGVTVFTPDGIENSEQGFEMPVANSRLGGPAVEGQQQHPNAVEVEIADGVDIDFPDVATARRSLRFRA